MNHAASALVNMATPPRVTAHALVKGSESPPSMKVTGMKRTTVRSLDVTYESSSGRRCRIELKEDEDDQAFVKRRCRAALALHDPRRADVFCAWNGRVVNIPIDSHAVFHETNQQKRYTIGNVLQLVHTRYTCVQWQRDDDMLCRSCVNRGFRASCLCPEYLYHLMPMPGFKSNAQMCNAVLSSLDPIDVPVVTKAWLDRLPQTYVR
jgi:hypothetical protein